MAAAVCRVCLVGNVKRFYIEDDNMLQIYRKLTSTQLNIGQRPRGVCYICLSLLQKCCRFSEMVHRSEQILTDLLNQGIVVSDDMPMPALDLGVQSKLSVAPMQTLIINGADTLEHVDLTIGDEPHVGTESVSEGEHITDEATVSNDFNETVAITHNTTNYSDLLSDNEPRAMISEPSESEDKFIKLELTLVENFDKVITNNDEPKHMEPELPAPEDKFIKFELTIDEDFGKITNNDTTTDLVPTYRNETVENTTLRNEHFMEKKTDKHDFYATVEQNKSTSPQIIENEDISSQKMNTGKLHACNICNKKFKHRSLVKRHMRVHSRKRLFVCKKCKESFTSYKIFEKHIQTHPAERFTCHVCNKTFAQKGYLIIHMRIHTNVKPFSCKYCDKSFIISSGLANHMRIHTGEKPYPCEYCNRDFRQSGQLRRHMNLNPEVNTMTCKYCTKSFNRKCMLLAHHKTHPEEILHECSLCHKTFATVKRLQSHTGKSHAKKKPLECLVCNKSFVDRKEFIQHMKTHNKIYQ